MRRFELADRFWEIDAKPRAITVRFGRIGSTGTTKTTAFATTRDATAAATKLVYEKEKKGYVEIKRPAPKATIDKRVAAAAAQGEAFAQLSALWAVKRPTLEAGLRKGATPAQLARFRKRLGLALPATFDALYAWHDGADDEDDWLEGPYGFCRLAHILSHKQIFDDVRGDDGTWSRAWVPFLQTNGEDFICIDTTTGAVFEWRNYGGKDRALLAPSLDAWLAAHIALTEAAKSLDDDDAVYDAFVGAKAKRVRARISPGYPKKG